jgi:hypothetical protein
MEATGGKQPLRARRGKGNGDADSGSCGNAVQCLNSPAVFLAFVEIYEGAPPALWLQCSYGRV